MTNETTHPFLAQFVALAGDVAEMVSYNRSLGQLYGLLYISPEPLSLEDIAATCRMSKGNASIHLRILENWNAVHRSSKPGTRKDYYVANTNVKNLIAQRFQEGLSKRLHLLRDRLDTLENGHSRSGSVTAHPQTMHWKKRLKEVDALIKQAERALPLIRHMIGLTGG